MRIGPYEIVRELARGGQGVVYVARDVRSGNTLALKHLHAQTPHALRRFETEVAALARMRHPSLVQIYDWGRDERGPWVAQELVEGKSLQNRLSHRGPMKVSEAVGIVASLAQALEHVHAAGVLHRDVKPENVILRSDGTPVLVDFGLARDLQSAQPRLSHVGASMGSPGYWSPEQARGELEKVGPATDVYGLGATLYALLAGRPPVEGDHLIHYVDLDRFRAITPLPETNPDVPRALWEVCAKCLCVDLESRYSTTNEVAQALAAYRESAYSNSGALSLQARPSKARLWIAGLVILCVSSAVWVSSPLGPFGKSTSTKPASIAEQSSAAAALLKEAQGAYKANDFVRAFALIDQAEKLPGVDKVRVATSRGVVLVGTGRTGEARMAFEQALRLDPKDTSALRNLGLLYRNLGDHAAALTYLEQALEGDPGNTGTLSATGETLLRLGEAQRALPLYNRALTLNTTNDAVWENRARARMALGDLEGALNDLNEAVRLKPNEFWHRLWRARVHKQLRQHAESLADVEVALQQRPENLSSLMLKGHVLVELGQFQQSLETVNALLAFDADHAEALRVRGRLLSQLNGKDNGLSELNRAIELAPLAAPAYVNRAVIHAGLGDLTRAISDTKRALELDPRHVGARQNLAAYYLRIGEGEAALEASQRALKIEPKSGQNIRLVAYSLLMLKRYEEARKLLNTLIAAAPKRPPPELKKVVARDYAARAKVHLELGLLPKANADVLAAFELVSFEAGATRVKARLLDQTGRRGEAIELLQRALQRAPRGAVHWALLGELWLAENSPTKARKAAERGLALKISPLTRKRLQAVIEACEPAREPR